MKRLSILFMLMLTASIATVKAQDLYVYSVSGSVNEVKGKISSAINVRQSLTMKSVVTLKAGSKLVLVDQKNSKQYTLTAAGTNSVQNLIAKSKDSTKSLTKMYLSYLMKQIAGKGVLTSQKAVDGGYASIERDVDEDSLFVDDEEIVPDSVK